MWTKKENKKYIFEYWRLGRYTYMEKRNSAFIFTKNVYQLWIRMQHQISRIDLLSNSKVRIYLVNLIGFSVFDTPTFNFKLFMIILKL